MAENAIGDYVPTAIEQQSQRECPADHLVHVQILVARQAPDEHHVPASLGQHVTRMIGKWDKSHTVSIDALPR